jgi:hypothetical protein
MNPYRTQRLPDVIAFVFFVLYFIIGLSIVGDYGVNWDDADQHFSGIRNVEYLIFHDPEPLRHVTDRYHGPAFEIVLVLIERALHISDTHTIYLMRHTVVFLYMAFCMVLFYFLLRRLFANKWVPLIGCLMLILQPRVFADSFYNPKDITAMGGMIAGMLTLVLLSDRPSWWRIILHAFVSAWCIDIRVICLMLPAATVGILLYKNIWLEKLPATNLTLKILSYLALTFAFMIPMWPILMDGPIDQLHSAVTMLSHYHIYHGLNLFFGTFYTGPTTPGAYQFVWFFMTTPVIYSVIFFVAVLMLCVALFKKSASLNSNIYVWLSLAFFIVPPAAMWYMHSVVFNSWRHVFMIYPFFVIVCVFAVSSMFEMGAQIRNATAAVLTAAFVFNIGMLCYLHPFEYVYFNPLTVECLKPLDRKFEIDYYGPSFKQGLEYLIRTQYRDRPLKVIVSNYPGRDNYAYLPPAERAKIQIVEPAQKDEADYYLNMHRWDKDTTLNRNLIYEFRRQGNRILSVYKLR